MPNVPNVPYVPNVRYVPNDPDNPAAGFSAVVPIFQRQKVDHRRLYCASEKLTAAEEGRIYIIYICISRRSVPNQFSPKTSEGATKQEYDEPHNRVVIGRNTKHPAARKRA